MASNALLLKSVARNMKRLGMRWHENTLFVSQCNGNDVDEATLVIGLAPSNEQDDTEYLKLRRLFKAMEYRFNKESTGYEIKVNIKRKAKR